jgi:hypothetical protein
MRSFALWLMVLCLAVFTFGCGQTEESKPEKTPGGPRAPSVSGTEEPGEGVKEKEEGEEKEKAGQEEEGQEQAKEKAPEKPAE